MAKQSPKKVRDYEARQETAGLRRMLVWVPDKPEYVEPVRDLAARFRELYRKIREADEKSE